MEVTLPNAQGPADLLTYSIPGLSRPPSLSTSQQLDDTTSQPSKTILTISSVFPFDFFPDTVAIEQNKVKIIFNHFSFSYRVHGILIRDITDVLVDIHLFLATLTMIDSSNYHYPIEIKVENLHIDEALRARSIILELVSAQRQQVNISSVPYQS
jgi:hypothetical protein